VASSDASSSGVPRLALFAAIAACALVILSAIALIVSVALGRQRSARGAGGGNILIR